MIVSFPRPHPNSNLSRWRSMVWETFSLELFALAENDIRAPYIHVIEILVIDEFEFEFEYDCGLWTTSPLKAVQWPPIHPSQH